MTDQAGPISVAERPSAFALGATLFATGAAVMAIEILGARVVGPHFGSTLYAWTALIAITLLALATGYWVGGSLADRVQSSRSLARLVGLAGVLTLFVPLLRATVIALSMHLGLRAGVLVAAAALFFGPLAVLGAVSP